MHVHNKLAVQITGYHRAQYTTTADGRRASTAKQYLRPVGAALVGAQYIIFCAQAMTRDNLHVLTDSLVTKVSAHHLVELSESHVRSGEHRHTVTPRRRRYLHAQ